MLRVERNQDAGDGEFFSETVHNIRQPRDTSASWAELYERHVERVRRYVKRLVGASGPASAEDLTQEVFVIAFKNWKSFRGSSSASTWLCGIAFNLTRRHLSREASASRALSELAAGVPGRTPDLPPDTFHLCREQESALLSAARELPGTLQSAFVLHCLSGLSAQEAAAELGVSEGNLRVRVARARAFVKQRLDVSGNS
jgi:RNA polymerase sigma-70 factor, ECF subfamily